MIEITQLHAFVTVAEGVVDITEYYLISNTSDQTFVGSEDPESGEQVTLYFTLPPDVQNVFFEGPGLGERFVEVEGGFADTEPVPPGTASSEVLFNYQLPYEEGITVDRLFLAPVRSVLFLVVAGEIGIEGPGISEAELMDTSMGPALSYTAGPFEVGEALSFTLVEGVEMPQPSTSPSMPPTSPGGQVATDPGKTGNSTNELFVGILFLAAAVAGAFALLRYSNVPDMPAAARPLVLKIADLDDEYESGDMPERVYAQKRQALKRQLGTLLKDQAGE